MLHAELIWRDELACAATAMQLAEGLRESLEHGGACIIELHGTLGAGKTTLSRHLLRTLGVQGRIKSPSYAVVEEHALPRHTVHHFDFYRFNDPQEWEDAGLRDVFAGPGLKLVEWPDKAEGLLPTPDVRIHIEIGDHDQRQVKLQAWTATGAQLLGQIAPPDHGLAAGQKASNHA